VGGTLGVPAACAAVPSFTEFLPASSVTFQAGGYSRRVTVWLPETDSPAVAGPVTV
jgi:hypothetical protein